MTKRETTLVVGGSVLDLPKMIACPGGCDSIGRWFVESLMKLDDTEGQVFTVRIECEHDK